MSGATRLPVFPDSPYCVENGDLWLRVQSNENGDEGKDRLKRAFGLKDREFGRRRLFLRDPRTFWKSLRRTR
jgi:hypothetical protein